MDRLIDEGLKSPHWPNVEGEVLSIDGLFAIVEICPLYGISKILESLLKVSYRLLEWSSCSNIFRRIIAIIHLFPYLEGEAFFYLI